MSHIVCLLLLPRELFEAHCFAEGCHVFRCGSLPAVCDFPVCLFAHPSCVSFPAVWLFRVCGHSATLRGVTASQLSGQTVPFPAVWSHCQFPFMWLSQLCCHIVALPAVSSHCGSASCLVRLRLCFCGLLYRRCFLLVCVHATMLPPPPVALPPPGFLLDLSVGRGLSVQLSVAVWARRSAGGKGSVARCSCRLSACVAWQGGAAQAERAHPRQLAGLT
jgi:hypothetical protein